jgi:hypothetical protein
MSNEDYESKVPENVREADAAKLEALLKEKNGIEKAIEGFKRLL